MALRTPPASPVAVTPVPLPAVRITEFTRGLHPGDTASVAARAPRGVACALSLQYGSAGASGSTAETTRVETKRVNADGVVAWSWTVEPPVGWDAAWVNVECGEGDLAGIDSVAIWIWPNDLSASVALPPGLLGTWAMDGDEGCCGWGDVTFVLGPCSLGERCGSLIEEDQPACHFPLVFGTVDARHGDFVLDAGEDDRAGCDERWGQGLHFVPAPDGTAKLWTADGLNVILHRVESFPTRSAAP
jgi:hypothetical protein